MRASSASSWQRRKIFRHCTGFRPCSTSPFSTFPSPCLLPHPVHYVILYLTRFPLPLPLPSPSLHSLSPFLPSVLYFFILSLSRFPFPFNFPLSISLLSTPFYYLILPLFHLLFFSFHSLLPFTFLYSCQHLSAYMVIHSSLINPLFRFNYIPSPSFPLIIYSLPLFS